MTLGILLGAVVGGERGGPLPLDLAAEAGEAYGDALGSGGVLVTGSVVTVGEARAMLKGRTQ